MLEVLYRATKYMNVEDALLAREEKPNKRERQDDTQQDQMRKKAQTGDWWDERHPKPPGGKVYKLHPTNGPDSSSSDAD